MGGVYFYFNKKFFLPWGFAYLSIYVHRKYYSYSPESVHVCLYRFLRANKRQAEIPLILIIDTYCCTQMVCLYLPQLVQDQFILQEQKYLTCKRQPLTFPANSYQNLSERL